jgi:hypothetical protein
MGGTAAYHPMPGDEVALDARHGTALRVQILRPSIDTVDTK